MKCKFTKKNLAACITINSKQFTTDLSWLETLHFKTDINNQTCSIYSFPIYAKYEWEIFFGAIINESVSLLLLVEAIRWSRGTLSTLQKSPSSTLFALPPDECHKRSTTFGVPAAEHLKVQI